MKQDHKLIKLAQVHTCKRCINRLPYSLKNENYCLIQGWYEDKKHLL